MDNETIRLSDLAGSTLYWTDADGNRKSVTFEEDPDKHKSDETDNENQTTIDPPEFDDEYRR